MVPKVNWTCKQNLRSHLDSVKSLAWHTDCLISSGEDCLMKIWRHGELLGTIRGTSCLTQNTSDPSTPCPATKANSILAALKESYANGTFPSSRREMPTASSTKNCIPMSFGNSTTAPRQTESYHLELMVWFNSSAATQSCNSSTNLPDTPTLSSCWCQPRWTGWVRTDSWQDMLGWWISWSLILKG